MAVGTRVTGVSGRPVARSESRQRRCPVCAERLSSYNPGPNCWTHTVEIPWRGPAGRPR